MKYEILYQDAFPVIRCELARGERVQAESDAMIAMSGTLDVEGSTGPGGIIGGLARRFLAGESFFFQIITASRGPGKVLLGHASPGGIIDVELDGSYSLRVQKDGFLAATAGIHVETAMQNLLKGVLSQGLFVLSISGRGTVFLSSYGAIHAINLGPGEEVVVDNGHLVAWPDYMQYSVEKASGSWISSFMSGECVVCRFRGPGVVLIQTRNPNAFGGWVQGLLPSRD